MLMTEIPREGALMWKVRAKRTPPPPPPPPPSLDGFTDDDIAVAEALVMLARSDGFRVPDADSPIFFLPKKRRRGGPSPSALFAAVDAVEEKSAAAETTTPTPATVDVKEQSAAVEEQSATPTPTPTEVQSPTVGTTTPPPAAAIAKSQKEVSPVSPLPNFHHCCICSQRFTSSQALGGHMTSHRAKNETTAAVGAGRRPAKARVHECSFCHEKFPTGQALGGHKRKHYEGTLVRKTLKFTLASSPAVAEETSHGTNNDRPLLPFDLNRMPPPEE